jgi:hypothetical protein
MTELRLSGGPLSTLAFLLGLIIDFMFIPHERKIDDLIAEGNRYVATFLKSLRKQLPEPAKYST